MGYRIFRLPWGASEAPPRYHGRSHFRPYVAKDEFLTGTFIAYVKENWEKVLKTEQTLRLGKLSNVASP